MPSQSPDNQASRASLDLLYHISRELAGTQDLRAILERVLFLSMRNVGAMSGSLIVLDDMGKPVESAIINGDVVLKDTTQQLRVMMERGLAGWVVNNRQPALIKDTNNDERWMVRQFEGEKRVESRSAVSAPLSVRERLVGVMTLVHRSKDFFNEDHLSLIQSIADQAAIAVLNGRLLGESQRQARRRVGHRQPDGGHRGRAHCYGHERPPLPVVQRPRRHEHQHAVALFGKL